MTYVGSRPANKAVTTSDIADDSITSAKIAAGVVVASDIADDSITLAKMASGTDGNIISYDASGNPVAIATGNDGMVLTSTGAGSPPAFEAVSAGTALTGSTNNQVTTVTGANAIVGEANLTYNGTFLGVGSGADLGSGVHVKKADSGGSVMSDNDALVLEGSAGIGMTLLGGHEDEQTIAFGDNGDSDIGFIKYHHNSNSMHLGTNAGEAMRITAERELLIGTTGELHSGGEKLAVSGAGSSLPILSLGVTHANTFGGVKFRNSNGEIGSVTYNANAVAYNTSSDYRLKEAVNYNFDATTRLKELKPARFNFISDETNTLVDGFLAHEVSSVVPEAISGVKDAMHPEVLYTADDELPEGKNIGDVKEATKINPQGIDQSKLVPLLVKTIQELEARITTLEDA